MNAWTVMLAGGIGSRFWPLSSMARPKQLLPLIGDETMLGETLARMAALAPPERTLILTNASLAAAVRALAPQVPAENVVAEPQPAGTAAALAWAAHEIVRRGGADALLYCVHADWAIGDVERYRTTLRAAGDAATRHNALVTVGIVPSRPDPGFGYIQPGEVLDGAVRRVARFAEKPNRERAAEFVAEGYLWNSGIFAWRAATYLEEVRAHCPEVAPALAAHPADLDAFFAAVTSVSVDVGVLERSANVLVLPGEFGWDDVGTWAALHRVRVRDASGNAAIGSVHLVDSHDNVVHADGGTVVLYGVDDLVVVSRRGITMVTTREQSADLKHLLDALPAVVRDRP